MRGFFKATTSVTNETSKQWPQFLAVISAAFLAIGSGVQNGWPSASIPKLLNNEMGFEINAEEVSYIVILTPLAYLIGSPLAGFLLDKIGRKYTLLFLAIPEIIPCILITTATNVPVLYVARFIMGIAEGALFTSLPIYMGEILEPKIRGIVGTSHSLGIILGMVLINIYGSYLPIRTAALISISLPVIFLASFIWMPESPYYLVIKERTQDARKALQRLRRMHNVEDELSQIIADIRRQLSEPGNIRDIFTIKTNLRAFFILMGLRTFQQFSGVTAIGFYLQVVFYQAGGSFSPAEAAIICFGIQFIVTFCGSLVVDRFGRIPMLMISSTSSAIILIILGLYFHFQSSGSDMTTFMWLPVTALVIYTAVVSIGLLMIPNLMAGEILSASIKSKTLAVVNMYLGLAIGGSSKIFQWLDQDFGMHMPFFVFGVCCVVSAVFCYFFVPETKGKTLEEIQQILKGADKTIQKREDVEVNHGENCSNRY